MDGQTKMFTGYLQPMIIIFFKQINSMYFWTTCRKKGSLNLTLSKLKIRLEPKVKLNSHDMKMILNRYIFYCIKYRDILQFLQIANLQILIWYLQIKTL